MYIIQIFLPLIMALFTSGPVEPVNGYSFTVNPGDDCHITNHQSGLTLLTQSDNDAWCAYTVIPGNSYTVMVLDRNDNPAAITFTADPHDQEYNPLGKE